MPVPPSSRSAALHTSPVTVTTVKPSTTPGRPAVTTDFDGNPTRIASYEVYARSTPFRRSEIGTLTPIATIPGTTLELTPPAGTQYYSVVVVDTHGNRSSF